MSIRFRGLRAETAVLLAFLAGFPMVSCQTDVVGVPVADLVITGGPIHTLDPGATLAEAVAIRGDRIVYVGSRSGVERFVGTQTRLIDLEGRAAFPGFVDAHAHMAGLGRKLRTLDVTATRNLEELCERVARAVAGRDRPGEWVTGRGWDQNDWPDRRFPRHQALSAVSPGNPVVLRRVDGHAILVNQQALEIAGVSGSTPDPPGGRIYRDERTGEPTGVLVDNAMWLVEKHVPEPGRDVKKAELLEAIQECIRHGLTGVHDAGVDGDTLEIYRQLAEEGRLGLRIYAMLDGASADLAEALRLGPQAASARHSLSVRSVKLYADGALGSRGAALLEPYRDDPGNAGLVVTSPERLFEITRDCLRAGFQVCTHAIGDRGNRIVLDAYERAMQEVRPVDPRLRIEHAQIVSLDDIPRFAALGVIPSMQPTHCTSDMDWAEDRLGSERMAGAYAWRRFLDAGCRIPCGSDFPVEQVDPLLGVIAAVTRQHPDGTPQQGWYPDERMTREEVIRGFTLDAAQAAFSESILGSLVPGKLADLTVFSRDIMTCSPREIAATTAWMTVIGGKVTYQATN